jgi:hypothetical protein
MTHIPAIVPAPIPGPWWSACSCSWREEIDRDEVSAFERARLHADTRNTSPKPDPTGGHEQEEAR